MPDSSDIDVQTNGGRVRLSVAKKWVLGILSAACFSLGGWAAKERSDIITRQDNAEKQNATYRAAVDSRLSVAESQFAAIDRELQYSRSDIRALMMRQGVQPVTPAPQSTITTRP